MLIQRPSRGHAAFTLSALLCAGVATGACAELIRVPGDYATIAAGIAAAAAGDEVVIAPGIYFEHALRFDGKAITVRGQNPQNPAIVEATIVDGEGKDSVFLFADSEGPESRLAGLTLQHGDAYRGGGISSHYASPTISQCLIRNNNATLGGGIDIYNGSPRIVGCRIIDNRVANDGGGVRSGPSSSSPTLTTCYIRGNHAGIGGGGVFVGAGSITIENTLLLDNDAGSNGGAINAYDGTATLINCTAAGNHASRYGDGGYFRRHGNKIHNSIFWNQGGDDIHGDGVDIEYSDTSILHNGIGNISADPQFLFGEGGEYQLDPTLSPCIDAGKPTTFDSCRPPGLGEPIADMGAYGGENNCALWRGCDDIYASFTHQLAPFPEHSDTTTVYLYNCGDQPQHLRLESDCAWLQSIPLEGSVLPGETIPVLLVADATDLEPGVQFCSSVLFVDDEPYQQMEVPIRVRTPFVVEADGALPETVNPGEDAVWNLVLRNVSPYEYQAQFWVDADLTNGLPAPNNPLVQPLELLLGANYGLPLTVHTVVPEETPIGGPYRIHNRLGKSLEEPWAEYAFDVGVVPPERAAE